MDEWRPLAASVTQRKAKRKRPMAKRSRAGADGGAALAGETSGAEESALRSGGPSRSNWANMEHVRYSGTHGWKAFTGCLSPRNPRKATRDI